MSKMQSSADRLAYLEQRLAVMAYIVLRHGEVYAPLMEWVEEEIEQVRAKGSIRDRAQQILKNSLSAVEGRHVAL